MKVSITERKLNEIISSAINKALNEDIKDLSNQGLNNGINALHTMMQKSGSIKPLPQYQGPLKEPVQNQQMFNSGYQPNMEFNVGNNMEQYVKNRLMKELNWNNYQAAALMGIIGSESGFKTHSVNRGEKNGTFTKSSANGGGYGAGLIQWSNDRKMKVLNLLKSVKGANCPQRVEDCSLEDQITMIIMELSSYYPRVKSTVSQTQNLRDALKTLYVKYVSGSSNTPGIPDENTLNRMIHRYANVNGTYGNGFDARLRKAQQYC